MYQARSRPDSGFLVYEGVPETSWCTRVYQRQVYQSGTRRDPEKMLGVPELAALVYQLTGLKGSHSLGEHIRAEHISPDFCYFLVDIIKYFAHIPWAPMTP